MKHLGGLDKTQETKVSAVSTACCALSLHCTTGCICNPNLWWAADRFILPAGDLEVLQTSSLANHRFPFRKWKILTSFLQTTEFAFLFILFHLAYHSNPPLRINKKKERKKMLQQRWNHDIKKNWGKAACWRRNVQEVVRPSIQTFKVCQFALTLL